LDQLIHTQVYGAVFGMAFNLVCFTLGVLMFNPGGQRPGLGRLLLNPVILGTLAGFACFLGSAPPCSARSTAATGPSSPAAPS